MNTQQVQPIRKPTTGDFAWLILLAVIWASAFPSMKVAVAETGPIWLVVYRALIGFLALLPWALWRGWRWPESLHEWRLILLLAGLNVCAPFFFISWGQQYLPSSTAALITAVGPIYALLFAHLTSHDDKFNWKKAAAVALGFSGVATVIGAEAWQGLHSNVLAQASVLLGPLCYTVSGTIFRRMPDFPPVRLSAMILGIAAAVMVPIALVQDGPPLEISGNALAATLYLGMVPTGIAYILRFRLIRLVGVSFFSHVGNLIPIFGLILGAYLLDEEISAIALLAIALIVAGLAMARLGAKPADATTQSEPH